MGIVYFGTPDFAAAPLIALHEAGHEIMLVVTQPDKPRGRGHALQFPPVREAALRLGIPVAQPERTRNTDFIGLLRAQKTELFAVTTFGQISPKKILKLPRYGCVNIHASLLPAHRGAAPVQWAVIDGQKESGIMTIQVDEELDTGDILRRYPLPTGPDETGGSLFTKLEKLGAEAILNTVRGLEAGSTIPEKRDETTTAYAEMLRKGMGNPDFTRDAANLLRLVRGFDPWPGTFTYLHEELLKIKQATEGGKASGKVPDEILTADSCDIFVQTGAGTLCVTVLQPEGKEAVAAADWFRGAKAQPEDRLQHSRNAENKG